MRCARSCLLALLGLQLLAVESAEAGSSRINEAQAALDDEITERLAENLFQSLENKFQVDLRSSVETVLKRISNLLQNGTSHVQQRFEELQSELYAAQERNDEKLNECVLLRSDEMTALAEKALHQMVLCGYALIGHNPAKTLAKVMLIKDDIRAGLKPLQAHKEEMLSLVKFCGYHHDTMEKVVRCVISKSPAIKGALIATNAKLIDGIVELTKLMAHGAMHEACIIEVVKSIEEESATLIDGVVNCANAMDLQAINYLNDGNAIIVDSDQIKESQTYDESSDANKGDVKTAKQIGKFIRLLSKKNNGKLDTDLRKKLSDLKNDLVSFQRTASITKAPDDYNY